MKNLIEKFLFWFKSTQVLKLISDPRDLHFKELLLGEYKPKYSSKILAPYFIENQYGLAVCSFEAWANALAVYFGEPVSARWLVAKAWQQGLCQKYGYAELRSGAKIAQKFGVVFEKDLPSDETMSWEEFTNLGPLFTSLDSIATNNKIGSYYFVDTYSEYLQAIDQGYAVVLGRDWYNPNPFTAPWVIGRTGTHYGAHATAGIGYKETLLIGANSWGKSWGFGGLYYVPLGDIQEDIDTYGAIAITPIPYTPKDIKLKSLLEQLQVVIDMIKKLTAKSKLDLFCEAIQQHEGWYPGSRSYRNNNPFNAKFIGQTGATVDPAGFAIFKDYQTGYNWGRNMVKNACLGKSKIYQPTDTILQFFQKYAPSADNNKPLEYAQIVASKVGVEIYYQIKNLIT